MKLFCLQDHDIRHSSGMLRASEFVDINVDGGL